METRLRFNNIDKEIKLIKRALALLIAVGPLNKFDRNGRAEYRDEITSTVHRLDREIHDIFYGSAPDEQD